MEFPVLMMMLYIFMFCSKVSLAQTGVDSFSYESQPQKVLHCDVTGTERSVAWFDSTGGSVGLFSYFENDDNPSNSSTGVNFKHSNFNYSFVGGSHFNLVINDVERTDGGSYDCVKSLFGGTVQTVSYMLLVEVPGTISIREGDSAIDSSLDVTVNETRQLTCQVKEARSSNNLAITWTPSSEPITENIPISDGVTLMDYNSTIEYEPARDRTTIACSLEQFESQLGKVTKSITLNVRYRPACILTYSSLGGGCTQVKLTCNCEAEPATQTYGFSQDGGAINGTISGNTATANVDKDSSTAFTCNASNSIDGSSGFGDTAQLDYPCSSTTEKPDSATKAPTTASSAGLIIGIIAAVVVVICLVAFLVWFFKFRGGEDDPTATNPSAIDGVTNGGGPNANVDPDSLPVYAEVNREKKSKTKSAPPPDNTDPEIPAYGVVNKPKKTPEPAPRGNTMELQYADLDHGNAPPSNQIRMPEEPTEYATVQSVVV